MLEHQTTKKVIYLCPKRIRSNWRQSLKKWKQGRLEKSPHRCFYKESICISLEFKVKFYIPKSDYQQYVGNKIFSIKIFKLAWRICGCETAHDIDAHVTVRCYIILLHSLCVYESIFRPCFPVLYISPFFLSALCLGPFVLLLYDLGHCHSFLQRHYSLSAFFFINPFLLS